MSGLKKASRTKSLSLNEDFPLRAPQRNRNNLGAKKVEDAGKILKYIDDGLIGKGVAFLGPFGRRKGKFFFSVQCLYNNYYLILSL